MFRVDFLAQDEISGFTWGQVPEDISISHRFHSGNRVGGCNVAEVELTGNPIALATCFDWLRRPVDIYNPQAQKVWWGFVREIRYSAPGYTISLSLDTMANKIKVVYTYKDGLTYTTGETSWASDSNSINRFGTKEYVHTLGEGDSGSALAAQTAALNALMSPSGAFSGAGSGKDTTVLVLCSGWFETLRWRKFTRLEGRMEFEPAESGFNQLIGYAFTATNISFEVAGTAPNETYTIKTLTDNRFDDLVAGAKVKVSGSASNNGTYTVESNSDTGKSLRVTEALVNEAAGASVTITAVGYETAQRFQATSNFTVDKIALEAKKVGSPGNLTYSIRADSGGTPGGVLLTASIANSEVSADTVSEVWITMPYTLSIVSGTYYWVCISKAGSLSATDYYITTRHGDSYDLIKGYDGSGWVSFLDSIQFQVWGAEENADQMARIVEDCGQFFKRLEIVDSTGIKTNQYRDGYLSAYEHFVKLFEQGNSAGLRLVAYVTPDRVLQVRVQNTDKENVGVLNADGSITQYGGADRPVGELLYDEWLSVDGFPLSLNSYLQVNPIYVSECRWDATRPAAFSVGSIEREYRL